MPHGKVTNSWSVAAPRSCCLPTLRRDDSARRTLVWSREDQTPQSGRQPSRTQLSVSPPKTGAPVTARRKIEPLDRLHEDRHGGKILPPAITVPTVSGHSGHSWVHKRNTRRGFNRVAKTTERACLAPSFGSIHVVSMGPRLSVDPQLDFLPRIIEMKCHPRISGDFSKFGRTHIRVKAQDTVCAIHISQNHGPQRGCPVDAKARQSRCMKKRTAVRHSQPEQVPRLRVSLAEIIIERRHGNRGVARIAVALRRFPFSV